MLFLLRFALLILDLSSEAATRGVLLKKLLLENLQYSQETPVLESLFYEKRLQHRCFLVNIAKFLRTPILKNICEQLLSCELLLFIYEDSTLFLYYYLLD